MRDVKNKFGVVRNVAFESDLLIIGFGFNRARYHSRYRRNLTIVSSANVVHSPIKTRSVSSKQINSIHPRHTGEAAKLTKKINANEFSTKKNSYDCFTSANYPKGFPAEQSQVVNRCGRVTLLGQRSGVKPLLESKATAQNSCLLFNTPNAEKQVSLNESELRPESKKNLLSAADQKNCSFVVNLQSSGSDSKKTHAFSDPVKSNSDRTFSGLVPTVCNKTDNFTDLSLKTEDRNSASSATTSENGYTIDSWLNEELNQQLYDYLPTSFCHSSLKPNVEDTPSQKMGTHTPKNVKDKVVRTVSDSLNNSLYSTCSSEHDVKYNEEKSFQVKTSHNTKGNIQKASELSKPEEKRSLSSQTSYTSISYIPPISCNQQKPEKLNGNIRKPPFVYVSRPLPHSISRNSRYSPVPRDTVSDTIALRQYSAVEKTQTNKIAQHVKAEIFR